MKKLLLIITFSLCSMQDEDHRRISSEIAGITCLCFKKSENDPLKDVLTKSLNKDRKPKIYANLSQERNAIKQLMLDKQMDISAIQDCNETRDALAMWAIEELLEQCAHEKERKKSQKIQKYASITCSLIGIAIPTMVAIFESIYFTEK